MELKIIIPDYDGEAMDVIWQKNSYYTVDIFDDEVQLKVNSLGLISIAQQMLYMAYNDLPEGSHIHYDEFFTKLNNKYSLIIEKIKYQSGDGTVID